MFASPTSYMLISSGVPLLNWDIFPLIPNQNINLEVLGSLAYINSSTTKVKTFST
jgi:hypothetical protein